MTHIVAAQTRDGMRAFGANYGGSPMLTVTTIPRCTSAPGATCTVRIALSPAVGARWCHLGEFRHAADATSACRDLLAMAAHARDWADFCLRFLEWARTRRPLQKEPTP